MEARSESRLAVGVRRQAGGTADQSTAPASAGLWRAPQALLCGRSRQAKQRQCSAAIIRKWCDRRSKRNRRRDHGVRAKSASVFQHDPADRAGSTPRTVVGTRRLAQQGTGRLTVSPTTAAIVEPTRIRETPAELFDMLGSSAVTSFGRVISVRGSLPGSDCLRQTSGRSGGQGHGRPLRQHPLRNPPSSP